MIRPYFERDGVVLYHGDCRVIVPQLGEQFADCIIADPPYGQTPLKWDRWPTDWPDVARAVLKPSGSLWGFGSLKMFMLRASQFSGLAFAEDIVWEKQNGSSFHADRFKRVHEQAARFYRSDAKWEEVYKAPVTTPDAVKRIVRKAKRPAHMGQIDKTPYVRDDGGQRLMRSVIYARSCHGSAENETQKPVAVVLPLIQSSCPPGGLVLSMFGGAGTDGVAALQAGCRAILIEAREEQCEIAAKRIAGGPLFRAEASA